MARLTDSVKISPHVAEVKNNGSPTILGDGYVDSFPWNWATFNLYVGANDTTVDAKVQESDDASSWSDVAGAAVTQIDAAQVHAVIEVNLAPGQSRKRYLKLLVTVGAGSTGALLYAECLLSVFSQAKADDLAAGDLGELVEV